MNTQILNNEEYNIIINENNNSIQIFNLNELMEKIKTYNKYKLYLYTINTTNYLEIKSTEFFKQLKKHCSQNLNYTLLDYIDHKQQCIKIYITPIVTSA